MAESAKTLADPHMEKLSITTKISNIDLIISNIYVSPASSCTGAYILSLYNLQKTTDTLILSATSQRAPLIITLKLY